VGAANAILRDLHMEGYDSRKFPRHYINFVDLPYQRPSIQSTDAITEGNAYLAAAQCQFCQEPKCMEDCPAGIDIPGFMRRMEAKNYTGAARLIRQMNPFGEVCGLVCTPNRTCQKNCYRRDFTGMPVRIAELQRWVCATAGKAGWIKASDTPGKQKVAVIGGGPSALTCAYYLTLADYQVSVFAQEARPGGALLLQGDADPQLLSAFHGDLDGIMSVGLRFEGNQKSVIDMDIKRLLEDYRAVYLPEAGVKSSPEKYSAHYGSDWMDTVDPNSGQLAKHPGIFIGEEYLMNGISVVEAVAYGRRAAYAIDRFINPQS
jgi:NADPH-dependent glutamate synthase beta subunit-like oxidoreductase